MNKRLFSLLLVLAMLFGVMAMLPTGAFAATTYGTVNGKPYTELTSLTSELSGSGTIVAHMSTDWNLYSDNSNDRITIKGDVTIYMEGHMLTRGLSSTGKYANVFKMESGSSLTLIGSTTDTEAATTHSGLTGYNSSGRRNVDLSSEVKGGVITGGYSGSNSWPLGSGTGSEGGAIQMSENCTLTLTNVTLAGNKANSEYGGAIRVGATGCTINMENSRVCYNYATQHGGGLRFDSGTINTYTAKLNMTESSIDHNYAGRNGGGIQCDGVLTLTGDGVSTVCYNECAGYANSNSVGGGGGIDCYYGGSVFKNIIVEYNRARSYQGGGLCLEGEEGTVISGCTIRYNTATGSNGQGGGVFVKHGKSSFADCEIHYNTAGTGDGVYLRTGTTALGGLLNITDNGTMSGTTLQTPGSNLYIASGAYVNPSLNNTSVIGVTVASPSSAGVQLSESAGTYSPYCYTYDNNNAYGFKWYNEDPSASVYRYLYLVSAANADKAPVAVTAVDGMTIAPDTTMPNGSYTTTNSQGSYPMIKTWFSDPSANDTVSDYDAICFYSDGYFFDDLDAYNEHLATMSHALTMAGFYTNLGNEGTALYDADEYAATRGTRYDNKHAHVRQLLANIGCEEESIYMNRFNLEQPGMDSIGVAIAHKEMTKANGDKYYLVPIVVRGSGYEGEWASNVTMGNGAELDDNSGEELGFAMAANMVYSEILDYVAAYGLSEAAAEGKLIFWVVGYSRAGATANLTARRLIDGESPAITQSLTTNTTLPTQALDGRAPVNWNGNQVVCYTFEAAQGGTDAGEQSSDKTVYYVLHNIINAADAVPMVAPTEMGFKRYGVDHYVPGTAAGSVAVTTKTVTRGAQSSIDVTTYTDNSYLTVGTAEYNTLRAEMLPQYKAFNPYVVFDDYFSRAEINWATSQLPIFSSPFNNPVSSNQTVEDYLTELMATLQSWKIEGRSWYTQDYVLKGGDSVAAEYTYQGKSFQSAVRDVFRLLYAKTPAETDQIVEDVKSVMGGVGLFGSYVNAADLLDLYTNVIQKWHTLSLSKKQEELAWVWGILEQTGVFDNFTEQEVNDLEQDWPILGDTLLTLLSKDYQDGDRQILGTLLYNYQRILNNHYAETVMAWLRASDSYYNDETARYQITRPATVAAPAAVAVGTTETTLTAGENRICNGDQVLHLDVESIGGEAIYYRVTGATTTRSGNNDWSLYTNGIELAAGDEQPITYTVEAYAISYGQRSDLTSYTVTVGNYLSVYGYSLSLKGNILVNAYLEVPEACQSAVVTLTSTDKKGVTQTQTIPVADADLKGSYRLFRFAVPAKNIGDTVTLTATLDGREETIFLNGAPVTSVSYSVLSYLEDCIRDNKPEEQTLVALCKAMVNYGTYAQIQQNYDVESARARTIYPSEAVDWTTIPVPVITTTGSGISYSATSLLMKSETTIRLYFRIPGDASNVRARIGDSETDLVLQKKPSSKIYYYLDISNISAKNLGDSYNVYVYDGDDSVRVTGVGAFYYVKQILSDPAELPEGVPSDLYHVAQALKNYGDAASVYFNSRS